MLKMSDLRHNSSVRAIFLMGEELLTKMKYHTVLKPTVGIQFGIWVKDDFQYLYDRP